MGNTYQPSDELVEAVIAGIATPLPFLAGKLVRNLPGNTFVMRTALGQVIPLSFAALAAARSAGTRIALMSHGELTPEADVGILRRIAKTFTPSEVTDVVKALQADLLRLAREDYGNDSWKLEATDSEVSLVIIKESFVRATADTAAGIFVDSFEALKKIRDLLPI